MKKESIYGLVFLSFIVLSIVIVNVGMVSAQDFWENWKEGALDRIDAKILLFIMTAIIILVILNTLGVRKIGISLLISLPLSFILTAFVTPDSILGIFRSYEAVPLVIATILPLLLFFALTYLSVVKASRALMTLQWLAWAIYFIYIAMKPFLYFVIQGGMGLMSSWEIVGIPAGGTIEAWWFWTATLITAVIAGMMTVWNGGFMNWALKHTVGLKDQEAWAEFENARRGYDLLSRFGSRPPARHP